MARLRTASRVSRQRHFVFEFAVAEALAHSHILLMGAMKRLHETDDGSRQTAANAIHANHLKRMAIAFPFKDFDDRGRVQITAFIKRRQRRRMKQWRGAGTKGLLELLAGLLGFLFGLRGLKSRRHRLHLREAILSQKRLIHRASNGLVALTSLCVFVAVFSLPQQGHEPLLALFGAKRNGVGSEQLVTHIFGQILLELLVDGVGFLLQGLGTHG